MKNVIKTNPELSILLGNLLGFIIMIIASSIPVSGMKVMFMALAFILDLPGMIIQYILMDGLIVNVILRFLSIAILNTAFYYFLYKIVIKIKNNKKK